MSALSAGLSPPGQLTVTLPWSLTRACLPLQKADEAWSHLTLVSFPDQGRKGLSSSYSQEEAAGAAATMPTPTEVQDIAGLPRCQLKSPPLQESKAEEVGVCCHPGTGGS